MLLAGVFLTENVTAPAGTVIDEGAKMYSFASTAITPLGSGVAGAAVAPGPPQAATTPAAPRTSMASGVGRGKRGMG